MLNRYRFDPPSLLLHIFIYLKLNGKYFRYSVIYILGNACGGITFETDKQEWTLRWGNELVVSENLEEKSILRSCYGKRDWYMLYISVNVCKLCSPPLE